MTEEYKLAIQPISLSWTEGTGKFDNPKNILVVVGKTVKPANMYHKSWTELTIAGDWLIKFGELILCLLVKNT